MIVSEGGVNAALCLSRAMQILSVGGDIDMERELNKVYRMFLQGQAHLVRLKGGYAIYHG